ncbi:outer membrane protein [Legionella impletisoli]|uniref:Outer membrane protein beta-barrel domain-containing protein n=1 Tax=Legionella impletisoli TaxID=343510 RepID=A0A917NDL4_9GAMM|nr:outer membrane beta-barrel protein [Legionella impletisoli]GGI92571.1 hypothetical protein GCM10007966_21510 [Legionella impletisoli]
MIKRFTFYVALLLSGSALAEGIEFVRPYVGAELGAFSAEDETKVTANILGFPLDMQIDGAGAHGLVYGATTGLGFRWRNLYLGVNGEYQKQEIEQSFSLEVAGDKILDSEGGMWQTYTATLRAGYYVMPNVLVFVGAGRAWSKAGSVLHNELLNEISRDNLTQNGWVGAIGTSIQPYEHWSLDLLAEGVRYDPVLLPTALSNVVKVRVVSVNVGALAAISYHF